MTVRVTVAWKLASHYCYLVLLLCVPPVYQDSGVMRIVRPGPDNTSLSWLVLTEFTTARV